MQNVLVLILAMTIVSCGANDAPSSSDSLAQSENLNAPSIEIAPENPQAPENRHLITIVAVASDGYNSNWKVTGECSHDEDIIKVNIIALNGDSSSAYVPCVEGYWIFNELYGNAIRRVAVTHGTAQNSLNMSNPVSIEESPVDCPSNYTWRHEITDVFGQAECHAIAYCPSGRPYEYTDSVSTQCAY